MGGQKHVHVKQAIMDMEQNNITFMGQYHLLATVTLGGSEDFAPKMFKLGLGVYGVAVRLMSILQH